VHSLFANIIQVVLIATLFWTPRASAANRTEMPREQQEALLKKIDAVYSLYFRTGSHPKRYQRLPGESRIGQMLSHLSANKTKDLFFRPNSTLFNILRDDIIAAQAIVENARNKPINWKLPEGYRLPLYREQMRYCHLGQLHHRQPTEEHFQTHLDITHRELDDTNTKGLLSPAQVSWIADSIATIQTASNWEPFVQDTYNSTHYAFANQKMQRFPFGFSIPHFSSDFYLPRKFFAEMVGVLPISIAEIPDRVVSIDGRDMNPWDHVIHDRVHSLAQLKALTEYSWLHWQTDYPKKRIQWTRNWLYSQYAVEQRRTLRNSIFGWIDKRTSQEQTILYDLLFEIWHEKAESIFQTGHHLPHLLGLIEREDGKYEKIRQRHLKLITPTAELTGTDRNTSLHNLVENEFYPALNEMIHHTAAP